MRRNETQFTWKNLDHRQFINPQIGFLGEAAIPNYPNIMLKHELEENLKSWKKSEILFRSFSEKIEFNIKVNVIQGNESLSVTLGQTKVNKNKSKECGQISLELEKQSIVNYQVIRAPADYGNELSQSDIEKLKGI